MKERNKENYLNNNAINIGWVKIPIGNIIIFEYGKGLISTKRNRIGNVPVFGSNGIVGFHSSALVNKPCLIIGRKGAAGAVHISNAPCWPIDTTYYVIPPTGINLRFLFHFLSELNLNYLDKSTAIPGLNRNDVYSISISIPPANEQNRIVEKVEELFTKLDAGVAALEKVRAQLKRYRQAVLKAAFSGQLTAEWRQKHSNVGAGSSRPNESKISDVHEGATTAPFGGQTNLIRQDRRMICAAAPLQNGNLPDLPSGWEWTTIDSISKTIYRYPTFYGMEHLKKGVPVIRGEHINQDGVISTIWDDYWFVDNNISQKFNKTILEINDLVMTVRGTIGRIGLVSSVHVGAQVSPNCLRISLNKQKYSPKFFYYFFNSLFGLNLIKNISNATTISTIKSTLFIQLQIPFPIIQEQNQIVSEIERRFSVADEVEKTVENSLRQARRLRQSILKMAFEGKLVPQDPNDEPAEKLLARIKKQKEEMVQVKKQKGRKNDLQS